MPHVILMSLTMIFAFFANCNTFESRYTAANDHSKRHVDSSEAGSKYPRLPEKNVSFDFVTENNNFQEVLRNNPIRHFLHYKHFFRDMIKKSKNKKKEKQHSESYVRNITLSINNITITRNQLNETDTRRKKTDKVLKLNARFENITALYDEIYITTGEVRKKNNNRRIHHDFHAKVGDGINSKNIPHRESTTTVINSGNKIRLKKYKRLKMQNKKILWNSKSNRNNTSKGNNNNHIDMPWKYKSRGNKPPPRDRRSWENHVNTKHDIVWPQKRVVELAGEITLGGLMMVHERQDDTVCGPVMPQGGIQALEAMLYTLDFINDNREDFIPNVTIGALILDDCDKDTYGLEQAVDFIKGKNLRSVPYFQLTIFIALIIFYFVAYMLKYRKGISNIIVCKGHFFLT